MSDRIVGRRHHIPNDPNIDSVDVEINNALRNSAQEDVHPHIAALRRGQPEEIAATPPPEFFTPEQLYMRFTEIQNQPSALDRFLDTLMARFERRQYQKLISDWNQYLETVGLTQDAYLRRVTERLNIPLKGTKTGATLRADIDEEVLRGSRARREHQKLWESPPPPPRERTPEDELEDEDIRWQQRRAWLLANNFPEDSDRYQQEQNIHEDIVIRILERMRRRA